MKLESRVERLEHEVKILKNEIQQILLDIQEQVLIHYYPTLRVEDADHTESLAPMVEALRARRRNANSPQPDEYDNATRGEHGGAGYTELEEDYDSSAEEENFRPAAPIHHRFNGKKYPVEQVGADRPKRAHPQTPARSFVQETDDAEIRPAKRTNGHSVTEQERTTVGPFIYDDDFETEFLQATLSEVEFETDNPGEDDEDFGTRSLAPRTREVSLGEIRHAPETTANLNGRQVHRPRANFSALADWTSESVAKVGKARVLDAVETYASSGYLARETHGLLAQLISLADDGPDAPVGPKAMMEVLRKLDQVVGQG